VLLGPLQFVVIGLDTPSVPPGVINRLRDLRDEKVIRLVDGVLAAKDGEGDITVVEDLPEEESALHGTLARTLFGYGVAGQLGAMIETESGFLRGAAGDFGLSEDQLLEVADLIPKNSTALFLLIEHLWALGLKEAVIDANGIVLANGWITPATLVEMGKTAAESFD
jgi:uncharacterized membrane protein